MAGVLFAKSSLLFVHCCSICRMSDPAVLGHRGHAFGWLLTKAEH